MRGIDGSSNCLKVDIILKCKNRTEGNLYDGDGYVFCQFSFGVAFTME